MRHPPQDGRPTPATQIVSCCIGPMVLNYSALYRVPFQATVQRAVLFSSSLKTCDDASNDNDNEKRTISSCEKHFNDRNRFNRIQMTFSSSFLVLLFSLPSSRQHPSCYDCLKNTREYCPNCSYCSTCICFAQIYRTITVVDPGLC